MKLVLATIISYLLGSIPTGYILAKALRGIDIRRFGSGNFGATNVFREVNPIAGIAVLILDMFKGLLPVTLIGDFVLVNFTPPQPILVRLILGLAAVCGHNWTVFLKFKGGKGVATTAGVLLGLSFEISQLSLIAGLCLIIWLLVVFATGWVSLGSILAGISLPIFMLIFQQPFELLVLSAVLCLFVVYRHKSNIGRMLRGEERKIFNMGGH